jgi:hypothetical protein
MSTYLEWAYARRRVREMIDAVIEEWQQDEDWHHYKDALEKEFATTRKKNSMFATIWKNFILKFTQEFDCQVEGDTPEEVADNAIKKCDVYHMIFDKIDAFVNKCVETDKMWDSTSYWDKIFIYKKWVNKNNEGDVNSLWRKIPMHDRINVMTKFIHWNRKK